MGNVKKKNGRVCGLLPSSGQPKTHRSQTFICFNQSLRENELIFSIQSQPSLNWKQFLMSAREVSISSLCIRDDPSREKQSLRLDFIQVKSHYWRWNHSS